jgi:hypothetical protein
LRRRRGGGGLVVGGLVFCKHGVRGRHRERSSQNRVRDFHGHFLSLFG